MKILFVCSGNAYRSPVAEALLRKFHPSVEVDSAGTDPAIPISVAAKKYLKDEAALKFLKQAPEGLQQKNLASYDLIIAMKPRHKALISAECPECTDRITVWDIDDPYFLPHGHTKRIFDQIKMKVSELTTLL
jgi:protein-tyrosine-phosphatase